MSTATIDHERTIMGTIDDIETSGTVKHRANKSEKRGFLLRALRRSDEVCERTFTMAPRTYAR